MVSEVLQQQYRVVIFFLETAKLSQRKINWYIWGEEEGHKDFVKILEKLLVLTMPESVDSTCPKTQLWMLYKCHYMRQEDLDIATAE